MRETHFYTYTIVPVLTQEDRREYSRVLQNANLRMEKKGIRQWKEELLQPEIVFAGDPSGYMALHRGKAAAVCYITETDPLFWRGYEEEPALYVHKLACREEYAGKGAAQALLRFCAEKARQEGKCFLRLACRAVQPKLRAVYEKMGFSYAGIAEIPSLGLVDALYEIRL